MIGGLPINTGDTSRTSFSTSASTTLFCRRLAIIYQSLFDLALYDGNEMYRECVCQQIHHDQTNSNLLLMLRGIEVTRARAIERKIVEATLIQVCRILRQSLHFIAVHCHSTLSVLLLLLSLDDNLLV